MSLHIPGWEIWILIMLIATAGRTASAQLRHQMAPEDPQWLKLDVTHSSLGIYSEGTFEHTRFEGTSPVDYSRFFIGPSIGFGLQGSIYHPNFARLFLDTEFAAGWAEDRVDTGGTTSTRSELERLGYLQSTLSLLNNKPYASSLSANYDHTYRDYDFFNRTTVDSWRYGAQTGYREGVVPFTITVWQLNEAEQNVIGFRSVTNISSAKTNVSTRPIYGTSSLDQTTLTLDAHNERDRASSRFNYGLSEYSRSDFDNTGGSTDHTIGLSDHEEFGSRNQIIWNNDLGYAKHRFTDSPSDDLNANSHLSIDHTPTVSTFYDADYYRATYGPSVSDSYNGAASVRHQLYQSLTSTLKVEGQRYNSSGTGGDLHTTRFGTSLAEGYTKTLSHSANLSINGTIGYFHTEVDQNATEITVIDEPHAFPTGAGGSPTDTFSLSQPNVIESTIVAADPPHSITYVEGIDYTISHNGLLTYLNRIAGSRIPAGGAVVVTYNAVPSPSGSYDTINGVLQIRFDLWNGLVGLYARLNSVQNDGTPGLVVQDINAVAVGSDLTWRFFRAGGECEFYDSTFSSYRSVRFYQSLAFRPDDASSLNFDFNEAWTKYLDSGRDERLFSFITRYHRRLTTHVGSDIEGGYSLRRGEGVDQDQAAFRPGLDFAMGKLSLKVSYNFEYESFLDTEERFKHLFYVRLKRTF